MIDNISELQEKLGYKFKNIDILLECFTHPSYSDEKKGEKNYERLEYLGDSVLGFVVSDYLYKNEEDDEGSMTEKKQNIVSSVPLALAAKSLSIEKYLLKEKYVKITDKICENLFEAVVGGIYLDGGLEEARNFIFKNLILSPNRSNFVRQEDFKSKINELTSKLRLGTIKYVVKEKLGEDHEPIFIVETFLNGNVVSSGKGNSKKSAEQDAAKNAYKILKSW